MDTVLKYSQGGTWREINQRVVRLLFLIGIIAVPFSCFIMNKLLIAGVALTLLSGSWREKWQILRAHQATIWVVIFFLLTLLGIFYSGGSLKSTVNGFARYSKVLYYLAFLPFLANEKYRYLVINAFAGFNAVKIFDVDIRRHQIVIDAFV